MTTKWVTVSRSNEWSNEEMARELEVRPAIMMMNLSVLVC